MKCAPAADRSPGGLILARSPTDGGDRRHLLVGLLLLAATLPAALSGTPAASAASAERYIVGFYEMPDERETYKGEPVLVVDQQLDFFVVETDEPEGFREEARQDERVRYLEEDRRDVNLAYDPNDPRYPDQYGPQVTKTDTAWDATRGSTSVVFGILDTGIAADHADFEDARLQDGYDYADDDTTPEDAAGCGYHGSHVAGTASATIDNGEGIAGISQHVVTMHKIFDGNETSCDGLFLSTVAQALEDLADKGAHISSNSWTTTKPSTTLNDAIDYAHSKGVVHVAAAGNDGPCTNCVDPPWKDRPGKVIVVSCTDSNDDFCSFSSEGPEIDVAAPGYAVLSVDGGDLNGYTKKSGTSMSTPHVSGVVSLYIDERGDDPFDTIETRVKDTADDVNLSADRQGGGRLDAGELVTTVEAPTASFTSDCQEVNCTFDASDSSDPDGTITSYDWEFGDGTTGSGEVVDHTYEEAGDYQVNLTVTDDDGATDEASQTVSLVIPPEATFESNCTELACTFDASDSSDPDGTITDYDWDFGDGTTGTGEVVDHTYESEGEYLVTLNVTDDDGASDEASQTIAVAEAPDAMHVHWVDHTSYGADVRGLAWIHDGNEVPAEGVEARIEICNALGMCRSSTDKTDASGQAWVNWPYGVAGPYTTCVLDVSHEDYVYTPEDDHAADGNCASDTVLPWGTG